MTNLTQKAVNKVKPDVSLVLIDMIPEYQLFVSSFVTKRFYGHHHLPSSDRGMAQEALTTLVVANAQFCGKERDNLS